MKPSHTSATIYSSLENYQKKAVRFCLRRNTAALFCEQGTGKTWITAGVIEKLVERNETLQALIVVPLSNLVSSWAKLIRTRLPKVKLCRDVEKLQDYKDDMHLVVLVHYEGFKKYQKLLLKMDWDLVVLDEAQRIKNRTSAQSRTAFKFNKVSERRVILTGTPMDQSEIDLYSQFTFLDDSLLGSWAEFEREYLPPKVKVKPGINPSSMRYREMMKQVMIANSKRKMLEEKKPQFYETIAPLCHRVTKEVLNLKPMHVITRYVKMRPHQEAVYNNLVDYRVHEFGDGSAVTSPLSITLINKLQQVCGGFIKNDDGVTKQVGSDKFKEVQKILNQFPNEPAVIFCKYSAEIELLRKKFTHSGLVVETLTGKVKKKDRPIILSKFQRGKIDVLICQTRTGGVGIDLFRSRLGIFYSMTHSFIDYEQILARLHRRGQEKEVYFFIIACKNTVDEKILTTIFQKRKITVHVLHEIQKERAKCRRKRLHPPRKERLTSSSMASRTLPRKQV